MFFHPLCLFWLSLIALGWLGVLAPHFNLTTPVEIVLPGGLADHLYVRDLVHIQATEFNPQGRAPIYRTAAPYPYTNNWGTAFALLLPCMLAYIMSVRDGMLRKVLIVSIPLGIVPAFFTLNRGMFLGVGVALGVLAIRALIRGNVRIVASVAGVAMVGWIFTLLIPVQEQINARVGRTDSTSDRLSVYGATLRAVLENRSSATACRPPSTPPAPRWRWAIRVARFRWAPRASCGWSRTATASSRCCASPASSCWWRGGCRVASRRRRSGSAPCRWSRWRSARSTV